MEGVVCALLPTSGQTSRKSFLSNFVATRDVTNMWPKIEITTYMLLSGVLLN